MGNAEYMGFRRSNENTGQMLFSQQQANSTEESDCGRVVEGAVPRIRPDGSVTCKCEKHQRIGSISGDHQRIGGSVECSTYISEKGPLCGTYQRKFDPNAIQANCKCEDFEKCHIQGCDPECGLGVLKTISCALKCHKMTGCQWDIDEGCEE